MPAQTNETAKALKLAIRETAALGKIQCLQLALAESPLKVELHHQLAQSAVATLETLQGGVEAAAHGLIQKSLPLAYISSPEEVARLRRLTSLYLTIAVNSPAPKAQVSAPGTESKRGRPPEPSRTALFAEIIHVMGKEALNSAAIEARLAKRGVSINKGKTPLRDHIRAVLATGRRKINGKRVKLFKRVGHGLYRISSEAAAALAPV